MLRSVAHTYDVRRTDVALFQNIHLFLACTPCAHRQTTTLSRLAAEGLSFKWDSRSPLVYHPYRTRGLAIGNLDKLLPTVVGHSATIMALVMCAPIFGTVRVSTNSDGAYNSCRRLW